MAGERKNLPGIKKSKYTHKSGKIVNPTKQKVMQELPTAQKYEFNPEDYLSFTNTPNWLPQEGLTIESVSTPTNVSNSEDKPKEIKPKKIKETQKETKFKNIESTKKPSQPSDMELAMMQAELEKAKQKQAEQEKLKQPEILPEIEIKQTATPKINMFEKINAIKQNTPVEETKEQTELKESELLMKVDHTEVRIAKNESDETVYIVDKEICTEEEYRVFLQQVAGKLLALDCRKLEYNGITYTRHKDGYKSSDGNDMSVDDMLDLINRRQ